MIKEFGEAWEKNKAELRKYFATTKQVEYDKYEKIVMALFNIVINPFLEEQGLSTFDVENIHVIDDGDYQGTQIFLLHEDTYQPSCENYIYTENYYGSCSGCDTLLSINEYEDDKPNEEQVGDYMTLSLHLLQKCKYLEATSSYELTDYMEILTDKEREYLATLFSPFHNDIEYVVKHKSALGGEYISYMTSKSLHTFPEFLPEEHYKNMKLGVHYTLKELGI